MRATAQINSTGKTKRLGFFPVKKRVTATGSTMVDTLDNLKENLLAAFDNMPDDQLQAWTDISISLNRS